MRASTTRHAIVRRSCITLTPPFILVELHTGQASRDAVRGNDDVTQADLAADIATYDRLRAENPDAQSIRGPFIANTNKLQEYAAAHEELGISRRIFPSVGLQGYRKTLLKAMQEHGLGR